MARDDATYVIVVSASRCGDGVLLARERQTAATKETVLPALGRALERVRAMLGESRDTLTAYDRPLQVATTDSIDALRAFELGMELRTRADNVRAIPALETAVALDPQFALAYAQLGSAYSNTGDTTNAKPYLRKAFELRDRATEPERLYITGRYFDIVTGELEKGVETYRLWTRMYPGEWLAFNALANDANLMGSYQIALDAATRAVALEPRQVFGQTNLLTALVALNRFDEAKKVAARMLERDPDNSSAHTARYAIADFLGDTAARDRELAWSRATADDSGVVYVEAESAAQHGRFAESSAAVSGRRSPQSGLAQRRRGREHPQRDGVVRRPCRPGRPGQRSRGRVGRSRADRHERRRRGHRLRPSPPRARHASAARRIRSRSAAVHAQHRRLRSDGTDGARA